MHLFLVNYKYGRGQNAITTHCSHGYGGEDEARDETKERILRKQRKREVEG